MSSAFERAARESLTADDIPLTTDESKLAELMLLVAEELADDRFGGSTKLNKVLFFAEFAHARETGRSISGSPYQKLPNGPAPRRLLPVRQHLVDSGAAAIRSESLLGLRQDRLVPLRPARRDRFTTGELRAVADAVAMLRGRSGTEASGLSHEEPGWRQAEAREVIPFATAQLLPEQPVTPRVRARAAEIAAEYGV